MTKSLADVAVAIVGPGAIGDCHARAIAGLRGRVVAIAGPKDDENAAFAAKHGVPETYRSIEELLERGAVDAVVIASPTAVHAEQTLLALRAGKDVLCEIPLALDYATAEEVVRVAAELGRRATVAHTLRFWAPHRDLRARIERGEIDVRHVVARSLQLRQTNHGWTGRLRDWTDSVLWHHGAHLVDAALWLLDETEVDVCGACGPEWPGSGARMDVSISLRTPSGSLASLSLSYHSRLAASDYLVIAEDQTYEIRDGQLLRPDGVVLASEGTAAVQDAAIAEQDREFLTAILEDRRPTFTAADALPALRVLQQLERTEAL